MKYIVMEHPDGEEFMVIFPDDPKMTHAEMEEAVVHLRVHKGHGQWQREFRLGRTVSAGFIRGGVCEGYSETLKLGSRGGVDTKLFKNGGHCG